MRVNVKRSEPFDRYIFLYAKRKPYTMLSFEPIVARVHPTKPKTDGKELVVIWESLPPANTMIMRARVALASGLPLVLRFNAVRTDVLYIGRKPRKIISHSFLKHIAAEAGYNLIIK